MEKAEVTPLQEINPDAIKPNPDNPRLVFHEDELVQLMTSIQEVGIKVPITAYAEGKHYVILDGERRWRCAKRLNLQSIPAIVQPKPSPLENILMMFNIHSMRQDWDLMPKALKLGQVRDMLIKQGRSHDPKSISALTGVSLTTVKRAFELLDLPAKYQKMLVKEAYKPRNEQRIKPDLFMEIYKSLHTVERYIPEVFDRVSRADFVEAMVGKYSTEVIDNVVAFRDLSKIARAERAGVERTAAVPVVLRLVRQKSYDLKTAYEDTVGAAYVTKGILSKINSLRRGLEEINGRIPNDLRTPLQELGLEIRRLLK